MEDRIHIQVLVTHPEDDPGDLHGGESNQIRMAVYRRGLLPLAGVSAHHDYAGSAVAGEPCIESEPGPYLGCRPQDAVVVLVGDLVAVAAGTTSRRQKQIPLKRAAPRSRINDQRTLSRGRPLGMK